jgi:hypothetical protein
MTGAKGVANMPSMAKKKKKQSGKHQSPRKPVQFPADWLQLARELAEERPMPVVWFLVELVKREAEAKGKKELPPLPWVTPKE